MRVLTVCDAAKELLPFTYLMEEKEVTMFGGDLNKKKVIMKVKFDRLLQLFGVNLQDIIIDLEEDTTVSHVLIERYGIDSSQLRTGK